MNTKLLMISPLDHDSTSFYRAAGPYGPLSRSMDLSLVKTNDCSWSTLKTVDAVFIQRPYLPMHAQVAKMARENGKVVILDFDDDLLQVPLSNRSYKFYSNPETRKAVVDSILNANVVTVSTPALAKSIQSILDQRGVTGVEIVVIPNAFDDELFEMPGTEPREREKMTVWRGSDTHDKDLFHHLGALMQLAPKYKDWHFRFLGDPFWLAIESLPKDQISTVGMLDPIEYSKYLGNLNASFMYVPLWPCGLNFCKSNIAWLEATMAGMAVIAPGWAEWDKPGITPYGDQADFKVAMEAALSGEIDFHAEFIKSREYILENLTLSHVNKLRAEIIAKIK